MRVFQLSYLEFPYGLDLIVCSSLSAKYAKCELVLFALEYLSRFCIYMVASAGNKISTQTGIGTVIAIAGVAMYSLIKANMEEQKRVTFYSLLHNFSIYAVGTWLCYKPLAINLNFQALP